MPPLQVVPPTAQPRLAEAIASIGTEAFGEALTGCIRETCGVDYCSSFRFGPRSMVAVSLSNPRDDMAVEHVWRYVYGRFWRRDEALSDVREQARRHGSAAIRMAPDEVSDGELREIVYTRLVDRLLVCSEQPEGLFGLSLLRWDASPRFGDDELRRLLDAMPTVMALIGQHARSHSRQRSPVEALRSVAEAEQCLADMTDMPAREREVCARSVCGCPAQAIAAELAISPETVKSYRKRLYLRLDVASERDLLVAYLRLWTRWRDEGARLPSPSQPRDMACMPRDPARYSVCIPALRSTVE